MPEGDALVSTGAAAAAIGVARGTLARWWAEGILSPTLVTPGGHARWDLDDLREQIRALRRADTDGANSGA